MKDFLFRHKFKLLLVAANIAFGFFLMGLIDMAAQQAFTVGTQYGHMICMNGG